MDQTSAVIAIDVSYDFWLFSDHFLNEVHNCCVFVESVDFAASLDYGILAAYFEIMH